MSARLTECMKSRTGAVSEWHIPIGSSRGTEMTSREITLFVIEFYRQSATAIVFATTG